MVNIIRQMLIKTLFHFSNKPTHVITLVISRFELNDDFLKFGNAFYMKI